MSIRKYEKKDGKQYYRVQAKVRNGLGKQISKVRLGVPTLVKAKRLEFELKMELLHFVKKTSVQKWEPWFNKCLEVISLEFKKSTTLCYKSILNKWATPHLKDKFLHEIKKSDIHAIVFQTETQVSDALRQKTLKQLRRIFTMAVEEGVLTHNPTVGIKVKVSEKKKLCLSSEEIKILLQQAYRVKHSYYETWALALMTGMRSGEMRALLWSDIDFENFYISVNKSYCKTNGTGPTKSSLTRSVPISKPLSVLLKGLKLKSCNGNYVLPKNQDWATGNQAKTLRAFCMECNITSVKFHDLRATFITQMLIKDVPLAKVMSIVGHSNIKTTMVYLRMVAKDVKGATEALGISLPSDISTGNLVSLGEVL